MPYGAADEVYVVPAGLVCYLRHPGVVFAMNGIGRAKADVYAVCIVYKLLSPLLTYISRYVAAYLVGKAQLAIGKRARSGPAAHYGAWVAVYAVAKLPCGAVALLYALAAVQHKHLKRAVQLKKLQSREYSGRTCAHYNYVIILGHSMFPPLAVHIIYSALVISTA